MIRWTWIRVSSGIAHLYYTTQKSTWMQEITSTLSKMSWGWTSSYVFASECNQCCPSPVCRPYQWLWALQTTRMQGTTWVQRQINSNSLIFESPMCVAACKTKFWSPPTKSHSKVFWEVGSSATILVYYYVISFSYYTSEGCF